MKRRWNAAVIHLGHSTPSGPTKNVPCDLPYPRELLRIPSVRQTFFQASGYRPGVRKMFISPREHVAIPEFKHMLQWTFSVGPDGV